MRPFRLWILGFVAYMLVIAAWSVASPYNAYPDEVAHIMRAYSVVHGDVLAKPAAAAGGTGAYEQVPVGLLNGAKSSCWQHHPTVAVSCAPAPTGDRTLVRWGNWVGRYNPFFYAVVGLPIGLSPTMGGVLAARLISGAVAAGLLAAALVAGVLYSRRRLLVGALLLAVSPMAINISSAVNPSGWEIAAGIAFVAAGLPVLADRGSPHHPRFLLITMTVSAAVLLTVRSGGIAWFAIAALALVIPLPWSRVRALLGDRPIRMVGLVLIAVAVASVSWTLVMKASQLAGAPLRPAWSRGQILMHILQVRWPELTDQMVGVFGWNDTHLGQAAYLLWEFPAAALLLAAAVVAGAVDRWRLVIIAGAPVAFTSAVEAVNAPRIAFVMQGRYVLPVLSGALLIAAWIVERQEVLDQRQVRRAVRALALLTLPIQLYALIVNMVRFQRGLVNYPALTSYNPFVGSWHPAVGSVTPLLLATLGLALLGAIAWRYAASSPPVPDRAEDVVPGVGAATVSVVPTTTSPC